jgi:hypothetical protein
MLPLSAAHATPTFYEADFNIYNVYGAAPPAAWGNVTVGATAHINFGWDPDAAAGSSSVFWTDGPMFTYELTVGDATISSGEMDSSRVAGTTSVAVHDNEPHVCTPPGNCAGGLDDWFVDDVFINFGCASWAGAPAKLPNLDCAGPLTGNLTFELFQPIYHQQYFGINASLSAIRSVPEPDSFSLAALGLVGLWIARRKPRPTAFAHP